MDFATEASSTCGCRWPTKRTFHDRFFDKRLTHSNKKRRETIAIALLTKILTFLEDQHRQTVGSRMCDRNNENANRGVVSSPAGGDRTHKDGTGSDRKRSPSRKNVIKGERGETTAVPRSKHQISEGLEPWGEEGSESQISRTWDGLATNRREGRQDIVTGIGQEVKTEVFRSMRRFGERRGSREQLWTAQGTALGGYPAGIQEGFTEELASEGGTISEIRRNGNTPTIAREEGD